MAVTLADLKLHVGATEDDYDAMLADHLLEAQALVGKYAKAWDETTETFVSHPSIPEAVLDRAVLEVAADLFNRRNAPNGIMNQQFATTDGVGYGAVRIARDPMAAAYKILARWVLPW